MAALGNFLINQFIDFMFRAQALGITGATAAAGTGPATLYLGLYTTADNTMDTGVEVTGGSYARVAITSSLANWSGTQGAGTTTVSTGTSGRISNNNAITFPAPTANWGTVVGIGIHDALVGGNLLYFAPLTTNDTVNNGDAAPSFPAGSLVFTVV